MREDDDMPHSLDDSNWPGEGGGAGNGGQNGAGKGAGGERDSHGVSARVGRLEGEFKHLATKADLEKGLSKLGTELRGEIAAGAEKQAGKIDGVKDELTGKIDGVKDELTAKIDKVIVEMAEIRGEMRHMRWMHYAILGLLLAQFVQPYLKQEPAAPPQWPAPQAPQYMQPPPWQGAPQQPVPQTQNQPPAQEPAGDAQMPQDSPSGGAEAGVRAAGPGGVARKAPSLRQGARPPR